MEKQLREPQVNVQRKQNRGSETARTWGPQVSSKPARGQMCALEPCWAFGCGCNKVDPSSPGEPQEREKERAEELSSQRELSKRRLTSCPPSCLHSDRAKEVFNHCIWDLDTVQKTTNTI